MRLVLLLALALTGCATTDQKSAADTPAGPFKLAITVDDLPVHGPIPAGMTAFEVNRQMVDAIVAARVPGVTGFVNGQWLDRDPSQRTTLDLWRKAGIPLANHTWSHPNLNAQSVDAYKQEITRNEPLLRSMTPGEGWRWFRYPFLAEGDDPAKRAEIRSFLADRGYRIASVTMDFSDWQFNGAYARCVEARDEASMRRMEGMYLDAAREQVQHSRGLARATFGRDIPYVQLMHVGVLSARLMPQLIDLYRSMGAEFVSLAEAQSDVAYAADNDPRMPPARNLEARANAQGNEITPPADRAPALDAMCR